MIATTDPRRETLTIEEAAAVLGIGRTLCFELARRGELPVIRLGRRVLVPRQALERLLAGDGRCAGTDGTAGDAA